MGMLNRSPAEIERVLRQRAADPRMRYILEPHERRALVELAQRQDTLDTETIKKLASYFGVTCKPVVLTLQANNLLPNGVEPSAQPETPKPQRPKLSLKLSPPIVQAEPVPAPAPAPIAPPPPPPPPSETSELTLARLRIQRDEAALRVRERQAEQDLRVAHNMRAESAMLIEQTEARMAHAEWLIARAEALGNHVERDPDAQPVRLLTEGTVKQIVMVMMRERDMRIADLESQLDACVGSRAMSQIEGWEIR